MSKNYCFTDLHGMYNLWEQIRDFAQTDDKLYFLGDAMDRGTGGVKIMKELFADPRIIYIKGNHEQIFIDTMIEYINNGRHEDELYDILCLWFSNGGIYSFHDFCNLNNNEQNKLIHECQELSDFVIYKSYNGHEVFLCHAGTGLHYDAADKLLIRDNPYLWDRHHFNQKWNPADSNLYMVHGHTPVQYIKPALNINLVPSYDEYKKPNILTYADGHKFDIDLGSFASDKIALFDLDELKVVKYFYGEDVN